MIKVDIKALLGKLNRQCTNALQGAAGLCVSRTNYEIGIEHFIEKLLEDASTDVSALFLTAGVEPGRFRRDLESALEEFRTGNAGKPVFSPLLLDLLSEAWTVASIDLGEPLVRSGAVLAALLDRPIQGAYMEPLRRIGRETLLKEFRALVKGSGEDPVAGPSAGVEGGAPRGDGSFLGRFCIDFTQKARDGGIDPVFGRDAEVRQMVDILARRRKNNPICVGDPGVGKTAVVEGLALRIVEGDVPELLRDCRLVSLDMGLLEAGAGVKGEFENRLRGVITEIKQSEKPVILFIDEAHVLIGAGGSAGGGDAANLLKPALSRGELRTIAATTWAEYKKYFEKDAALARRFQLVKLDAPSVEDTVLILRGLRATYERSHQVAVRDDALAAAAEFADKHIQGRFLPDKAIDLLDTSCARVKVNLSAKPPRLEDKERSIQALEREREALDRDRAHGNPVDAERYEGIQADIARFLAEAGDLRERWERERLAAHHLLDLRNQVAATTGEAQEALAALRDEAAAQLREIQGEAPLLQVEVNPDVVAQVVSDWTGVPLGKVLRDEAEGILHLEARLGERIKGQDHALAAIARSLKSAKAGIKDPRQPLGVFLLTGPSGVGKTETALALADLLFGSDRNVVSINMSEFQERHTVSRLVGSPPGYVGYGEGGMLTEAVRQKPYSVVILDEAEKAHIDVLNLFYQVFDKGLLTDGEGKEISFRNTIILLASNLGSDVVAELTGSETQPMDVVANAIRPLLSQHFKPALLARMTILPYYNLDAAAMRLIVDQKLKRVAETLKANNRMELSYTPAVVDQILARCSEVETGARNIDFILHANVLPRLSEEVLAHMAEGGMPSRALLDHGEDGGFTFAFE